MRIQTRTLILISSFGALFLGMLSMHGAYERDQVVVSLEERETDKQTLLDRVLRLASRPLASFVYDNSCWDDMCDFADHGDEVWAEENIDPSLKTLTGQAVWVYRKDLTLVYSVNTLADSTLTELPLTARQMGTLVVRHAFSYFFIPTAQGPMEVHGAPIQPSSDDERLTDPRGYLFVGRLWSPPYLYELSAIAAADLSLTAPDSTLPRSSHDVRAFTVTNRVNLRSWNGRPLAVLVAVTEYPAMAKSFRELRFFSLTSMVFVLLIMLGISLFLFRYVTHPLERITASLTKHDPKLIEGVVHCRTEFAALARLIIEFFQQRETLQGEIEQRRLSEAALRESEQRFHDLADLLPLVIFETDETGHFVFVSRRASEVFRIPPSLDIRTLSVLDMVIPEDRERAHALLCRLLNGGSMTGVEEFIGRRHDGTTLHVAVDVCPVECDGRICGIRGFAMDITESKAAVEALRQSRERLYTLIETAPLPICILDREGRVSDVWNPAAEELLGWSRAEVVGKPFPAVPEQGRDTFEQALIALRDGETLRDIEVHPRARDGSFLTTSLWAARLSDPQGRFCGCIGVLVDLSERKRAEQALRESEERFRDLSDTAPVLIWMAGADRHCFYFNKNWFKFTGRPLQQEYGKGWMSGVHTDDLESCLASYRSAFASRRPFSIEFRLRAADGSYHWVLDCGAPRYNADGAFAGYIGTCTDISDRKAAEEALRESETRFRTIFEGARDPIFIKDSDGKYVQANPATARSLNCTTAELIGRSDDEFFEPGLAAQIAENDRRALAGEAMECEIAFTVAGKEITYHVVKVPLRNANGRITGLVGVARDISEHKCAEEHLREEKEKAQRYLDIVGTVVVAINADQTVNLINQAGCRLLGASEEEIRGLNWFDHFVPERVRRSVREVFAQVIAGDMQHAEHFENPVLTRGGEERVIEWRNTVLRDESGHIIGTLSAGQDVTEQRRSAAVAQVIIEAAPLPMVVMRVADGKILYANGPLRRALGVSEDTADMSTLPYFQNPEMHTRAIEQIRREGAVGPMRVTLNRPDGSPVSFMGAARLFKLEGDDVIVAMAVPITEDAVDTSRSADSPGFASHHLEALYTEIKESLDRARQAAAPKPQDKWET